jgi:NADH dehydrogenase
MNRGPQILSGDPNERLRQTVLMALGQLAVPVRLLTETPVTALHPGQVEYTYNGQPAVLEAETIVWTAGTATHPVVENLDIPEEQRDKHGRPLITQPSLSRLSRRLCWRRLRHAA